MEVLTLEALLWLKVENEGEFWQGTWEGRRWWMVS
jgi:hypothetical protein